MATIPILDMVLSSNFRLLDKFLSRPP